MNSNYRHLDEQTMEQYGNAWIPSIPLPFYQSTKRKLLALKPTYVYVCGCGARFSHEAVYREHYRTEQMLEMNAKMARTRDLSKAKALYWRRYAFIMEHGTDQEKNELRLIEGVEMKDLAAIEMIIARVTDLWQPIYERWGKTNNVSIGRMMEETEVTDEEPERAAKDMADKFYSHTNSKGVTYILHSREVSLRGGKMVRIYYFRKDVLHRDVCKELPADRVVRENPRNGFLTIGRKDEQSEAGHVG